MANKNEASVEEILESIKKVIARDSSNIALEARKRKIDAAEKLDEQNHAEEAETEAENEGVLDLAEMELSEAIEMDESEWDEPETDETGESSLITEEVRGAMQENLAALAMLAEPGAKPQIVRSGETSLEGLTRELMRPMLAEWLDKNLPGMVEKMVQAEIARIAGKRG